MSFANLQSSRTWESDFLQITSNSSGHQESNTVPGTLEVLVHWMDEKIGKISITGFGDNGAKVSVVFCQLVLFLLSVILFSVISIPPSAK